MTFGEVDLDWDGSVVIDDVEEISVSVDGEDLFIGVARAGDVDRFLATDLPPQSVDIWLENASGPDPTIDIDTDGLWTAVVMNADGTRGVAGDDSVGQAAVACSQARAAGERSPAAVRRCVPPAAARTGTGGRTSAGARLTDRADVLEPAFTGRLRRV